MEDNGYAKFWGVNKVHYGLRKNGEYEKSSPPTPQNKTVQKSYESKLRPYLPLLTVCW